MQLKQPDFAERVILILEETKLEAPYVELEITESNLIECFEAALEMLHQFWKFGIKVALDDFGKGYSSLSYIRMLPINRAGAAACLLAAMRLRLHSRVLDRKTDALRSNFRFYREAA